MRRDDVLLEAREVVRGEVEDPREERHPGVPRRDVDRRDALVAREPPGDRVLAPTPAEDETVEAGRARRAAGASLRALLFDDPVDPVTAEDVADYSHVGSISRFARDALRLTVFSRRGKAAPPSLPLDRRRRLRRHVVADAVHAGHLVHDPRAHALEEVLRETRPVRRHEVLGRHGAERDERAVRAVVALHTDAAHRREDREGLRDGAIEVRRPQLLEEDGVRAAQGVELLAVDRADDADREPGTGERMPPEDVLGNTELRADPPDLVLEEAAQGR